jgi:hypothetical protein
MQPSVSLVRSPSDRSLPPIFVPVAKAPHRTHKPYELRIQSETDVEVARRAKVPLFVLTASDVSRLRYPMQFPSVLFSTSEWLAALRAPSFITKQAYALPEDPRDEDVITYLLRVDTIAARAVLDRNLRTIDRDLLTRRITEERLNARATRVRMQDRLPKLITVGESLPKQQLKHVLVRNQPH